VKCIGVDCERRDAERIPSDHEIGGEVRYYWLCGECQAELNA